MALVHLLSALNSYEMHFEMFKPLAFARHFFRYIVRERRGLARMRLMAVIAAAEFGLLGPAVKIMNDVITCFWESRNTKESTLYPKDARRPGIDPAERPSANVECVKSLLAAATVGTVLQNYGATLSHQYVVCAIRIARVFSESLDPTGSAPDGAPHGGASPATTPSSRKSSKGHHRRRAQAQTDDAGGLGSGASGSPSDLSEVVLKSADTLIADSLGKEFKADFSDIKHELMLERAQLYLRQWRWDAAIKLASHLLKGMTKEREGKEEISGASFLDIPLLLREGIRFYASMVITRASFQVHDYAVTEQFASPYYKALVAIAKADFDGAVQDLSLMTCRKPVTRFHLDYILSVGQLVCLITGNPKLVDLWHLKTRTTITPNEFLANLIDETMTFFVEELGIKESKSYYLRHTFLLIRLKLLQASLLTDQVAYPEAIQLIEAAETLMMADCPYASRGLTYQLSVQSLRRKMHIFLAGSPPFLQCWNQDIPAVVDVDSGERIASAINQALTNAPDMMVFPITKQAALDYVALVGCSSAESSVKVEHCYAALRVAYSVRSVKRIIQTSMAKYPDTAPSNCPGLLLNESSNQTQRSLASSYYTHVCSLDLPYFDQEILEMRSYLFYKFFEDQFDCFKLTYKLTLDADAGMLSGQWYEVATKDLQTRTRFPDQGGRASSVAKSAVSIRSSTSSSSLRKSGGGSRGAGSGVLRGILHFFFGIMVENDDPKKRPPLAKGQSAPPPVPTSLKMTPLVITAQLSDLQTMCEDFAELGLRLNEAAKFELAEADSEPVVVSKETPDTSKGSKRKQPQKPQKVVERPEASLLKHQAELITKRAELQWSLSVSKAELVFSKSNRTVAALMNQKDRWPPEAKITGIEMANALPISHFFNAAYGIHEKAGQFGDWLTNSAPAIRAQPT
jgi:hypothetical protein